MLQVVLKFKYNFWQKVVQEADFFGHVPQSHEGRGHCGLFYDLCRKVQNITILTIYPLTTNIHVQLTHGTVTDFCLVVRY